MNRDRLTAAVRRAFRRAPGAARLGTSVLAGVLLAPAAADAQLAVNRLELVLLPNIPAERAGVVTVRNESAEAVQATVKFEDWDRAEDGTNRWFPLGSLPRSCGTVLKVFPLSLSLAPGAEQSVRVALDSAAAVPRPCWSGLVLETVQRNPQARTSARMIVRTAVKLYVEPPNTTVDGAVTEMRVISAPGKAAPDTGRQVEMVFANTGTRRLEAAGTLEIRRPDNSVVAKVPTPTVYALPDSRRRFQVPIPALMPGRYILLGTMDFGGDEIAAAQIEYEVR